MSQLNVAFDSDEITVWLTADGNHYPFPSVFGALTAAESGLSRYGSANSGFHLARTQDVWSEDPEPECSCLSGKRYALNFDELRRRSVLVDSSGDVVGTSAPDELTICLTDGVIALVTSLLGVPDEKVCVTPAGGRGSFPVSLAWDVFVAKEG